MLKKPFEWAVVGAGPAGIAAVGQLLDSGIESKSILWIDPQFKVGDLGHFWSNVSSNTRVQLFMDFLNAARSFAYDQSPDFSIDHLPSEQTCTLRHIVEPLQWVTEHLCKRVQTARTLIQDLSLRERTWNLNSNDSQTFYAKNVILANGALPERLNHPAIEEVPFYLAIDENKIKQSINPKETFAVFGSSHSAILILKNLVDLGVKKIINFYRSPISYAIQMEDWILFDNTGLKGHAAEWARKNIDGKLPSNLVRYPSTEPNLTHYLPQCDKSIYAVGFTRRSNIVIGDYPNAHYNPHLGIIGPGLFGLGIAYPEVLPNPFGSVEQQVGLWKFMVYLTKVLPVWLKYPA
jgi:hypothetical protein